MNYDIFFNSFIENKVIINFGEIDLFLQTYKYFKNKELVANVVKMFTSSDKETRKLAYTIIKDKDYLSQSFVKNFLIYKSFYPKI